MTNIGFAGRDGVFTLENAENITGLYLPLAGERGLKSAVTPNLGGDSKIDQNTFLLEPVSIENLHTQLLVPYGGRSDLVCLRCVRCAGGREIRSKAGKKPCYRRVSLAGIGAGGRAGVVR